MDSLIPIADAESKLMIAEAYLKARLDACATFIRQTFDPLINSSNLAANAQLLERAFARTCEFTRDVDDVTLKITGQILKFYGILLKKYPLLLKILERERWGKKRRLFE